jgi:uncharacterized protein
MKHASHISLESVLDLPVAFALELPFSIRELDREPLVEISPVRMTGEIARIEGGHSLNARVSYSGKLECSRCLAAYPFTEDERFSLLLYKRPPAAGGEVSIEKDDFDAFFYDDPEISLTPIAEERIQMAVPMKPLCREECRGLCARCGQDLNQGDCRCSEGTGDPRLDALRGLTSVRGSSEGSAVSSMKKE